MSRSREGTWLTVRSPIFRTPREMSSSPATIRNAVVFPQPDGPTSTMNSPFEISRSSPFTAVVPSGYVLVTPSKLTAAMRTPSIDAAGILLRPGLFAQTLVQPVDQIRHRLEPVRDHAEPELAEVLRLHAEAFGERSHDVVRRHGPVAVHEVIEIAGGEARAGGQLPVGDSGLGHERLDRRAERLLAEPPPARHQRRSFPRAATSNRSSSPVARFLTSTLPSSRLFFPAVTRIGQPIRSASANFSPARMSRSSRSTSSPAAASASAACSAIDSAP